MEEKEVKIGNISSFDVSLVPTSFNLTDVEVIGHGKARKVNLTHRRKNN
jgi:hypothetical protein